MRSAAADVLVVGGGHNGLVAACYRARAGREVVVLEALEWPGGGSRTAETVPGFHFDLHPVAHNIINMTAIPAELELADAGLEYLEMDPFSVAIRADGRRVRFYRSLERTVESIAETSEPEARAYRRFVERGDHVLELILPAIRGGHALWSAPGRARAAAPLARRRVPLRRAGGAD